MRKRSSAGTRHAKGAENNGIMIGKKKKKNDESSVRACAGVSRASTLSAGNWE